MRDPMDRMLPFDSLRIDLRNPRMADVQKGQLDAIQSTAHELEDKIIALASHIAVNGMNPVDRFMVFESTTPGIYTVVDGNRRFTALKLLEAPEIVEGIFSSANYKRMREFSLAYHKHPIEDVACVEFDSREAADIWVELTHDGESGGAGTVKWSAQQKNRYQARKGKKAYHLQVLDFVSSESESISKQTKEKIDRGRYPTTTLQRLLGTPYVRRKLGIEKKEDAVLTRYPKSEILTGLSKLVDEIGSGAVSVNDLRSQGDRIDYINRFTSQELPNPLVEKGDLVRIEESVGQSTGEEGGEEGENPANTYARRHSSSRKYLIPSSLTLVINVTRINDIFIELKKRLEVKKCSNAVAVLMRVFIELSVDEYIQKNQIQVQGRDYLKNKITAVLEFMRNSSIMTSHECTPIARAASDPNDTNSTTNLNSYVHNRRVVPGPEDLKATWDTLQLFVEKLWS